MRFAYADPPYLGYCNYYEHNHPDGRCWDDLETHRLLIERLVDEFPDGWALSLHAPSLVQLLPLVPPTEVRVAAWCKTWHQIRVNVSVQYAWEPVLIFRGRPRSNSPMVRDWMACAATRKRGTIGAKPEQFVAWVLDMLGAEPDDELVDLFYGSGSVSDAFTAWRLARPLPFPEPVEPAEELDFS